MPSGKAKDICGAKKAHGGVCGLAAGHGTDHPGFGKCKWHFGNTAHGKKAAAKQAGMKLMRYVDPFEVDPTTALLEELYRTAGHVRYLDRQIEQWEFDTTAEIPDSQKQWMAVHMNERKHMAEVAKLALVAGIAERQIQLAEQQGMILAGAIEQILDRLGLTQSQIDLVPRVVPEVLRSLSFRTPEVIEGG